MSESRMRVVKHSILNGEVASRLDQVVSQLGGAIQSVETNYADHYMINLTSQRSVRKKAVQAEELWQKRGPPKATGTYSEKPKLPLVNQVTKMLLSQNKSNKQKKQVELQSNDIKRPLQMIGDKNLCWLNSSMQLTLSNRELLNNLLKSQGDLFEDEYYSKVEQSITSYLIQLEKTPSSAVITEQAIITHINDLREYGPKQYQSSTNAYIPIIQEVDKTSCVRDYLSYILVPTVSNFIDVELNIISTLKCD
ncbi:unnamed protein product, partial [Didymodactylos carnosus]